MSPDTDRVAGFITALYLFDVAQAIDLDVLRRELGSRAAAARLDDKSSGPPRLHYAVPPLVADGEALECATLADFRVRLKFYDYGVISFMLTRGFDGTWSDLVAQGQTLIESEPLEQATTDACQRLLTRLAATLTERRASVLSEDYLVFAVTSHSAGGRAEDLLASRGAEIAQLLRGERQPLARQERDVVLRNALSYLDDDLVIPAWNATFIADTDAAALSAIEMLEFANSQLLEYRYHDDLLDSELARIYATLQKPRWTDRFAGRRYSAAARHVHALFIDVNELTDRTENAVKFAGDIYSARLFGLVAARLGLERWKKNVEDKLETLDDIYRFAVEQTGMAQGNTLEWIIIAILVIELLQSIRAV